MNAFRILQKYCLHFLILIIFFDKTCSHENDTSTGHRHGRVSGRIVKLYSGPKPDPILCTSEGFLADAVDCSVFYRCLKTSNGKYTVYRFQCGPGTVYDPDTEVCNHPRSTKRLECGGLSRDKIVSSTEKYSENEIDGMNKENQEVPSPITTKPPEYNMSTTFASLKPVNPISSYTTSNSWLSTSKQENVETTKSTAASPLNIPIAVSSKNPSVYTPTKATYYVTRQPNVQKGPQCTSDGFMGDIEDCRKFYRCVNNQRGGYIRYEFSCSELTIWDDDSQGCNHPWAVQRRRCGKGNSYDENSISYFEQIKNNELTPSNIIQQQTQIAYGSKITEIQPQITTSSTVQNQIQVDFGDRLNLENHNKIQNQTQISYGSPLSQSHIQFNYGNEVVQSEPQVGQSDSPSQILDNILSSTTIVPSTSYSKGHSANRCTKVGFMGDSNDCKKFYRCISDTKGGFSMYEFSCSGDTLWDEQLETCNHARAVKECGSRKSSQNILPITGTNEKTTFKYYTTTHSSLNDNEIDELGYGSQNHQQEPQSPIPSTVTQATLLSTSTAKSSKQHETTNCNSNGFFGNINDCARFYRCVENGNGRFIKYEYKCGDGTVWDPQIESCNHAWSVTSCNTNKINGIQKENIAVQSTGDNNMIITTVSLIQTTTQKNILIHDYDSGYDTLHRETPSQSTTTTERISNQGNKCTSSGFMGDSDCKKFYRCVENSHGDYTRYEFTCGEGTVWDPDIEACNHAWAVKKCGGSTIKDNPTTFSPSVSQDNSVKDDNYITNQDNSKDPNSTIKPTTSRSTTSFVTSVTERANDCQSSGFMGDDNDCKIFYRCVENGQGGFNRYEFSCGDGTVWDQQISACNHAWAVEKCGGNNSTHEYLSTSTENSNVTTVSIGSEISTQHTISSSTIITSTISGENKQCMAEGFIGDKQDCKKFYRCVDDGKGNYIRYEFACGEGTVWDSNIQACNHAWAVKSCTGNEFSGSESTLTSHPTTMKDEEAINNSVTQNSHETSGSTENSSWSSSTIKSPNEMGESNECSKDGFVGDNKDCKKFYRCVSDGSGNFIRYEFSCGDGTVWDSEINACNHVNLVKVPCSSLTNQTIEEKEPNDISGTSTLSQANDYSTTSKRPPMSQQCEEEGFFGDKNDCKKFYRCVDNGQQGFHKYEFTCGEGTIWDQKLLGCNHASSGLHCSSNNTETQTENSDIHSTTTPIVTSQSTEKAQTSLNKDQCTSEGFYANSNDCKKFFRCVGNGKGGFTKYDFTCGEGTIWVQDIQACDHDSDSSLCSTGTITTTTIAPSHSSQEKPITTISTSTVTSTTIDSSISASSTKPTMQDETVSGSSSTSSTSSASSTTASDINQDHCEEAGYFGNTKNCKMFYRCVDNGKGGYTKYDFTCGDGTIWDQDITACNHPQDVSNPSCENEGSTSPTTITTTTTKSTSTTTVNNETSQTTKGTSPVESTTTQSSNQSTQNHGTQNPNTNNYTCNEAGFYADPYDCKKFYRCVDWGGDGKTFSIYHFECGEGTIWDPNLQTCNHEESVYPPRECSGTQSQNENNNNTSTTAKQEQTTESSTTDGSTTTTQSTTEKSTTQSSTTTSESSSTTDQTSTQQSSTSDQTSSTDQSSTQPSTTEQTTTQKATTEQSTTSKTTTEQSTTESNTTQQPTTEQSTTQQSTTEQSTTQQSSTTSEQTTAQQSSTSEQTTTSTTEQTTTTTEETTTTSNEETTTTTAKTTTSESTTSTADQTTKAEQSTTQESTEQSTENQSSTTEQSTTQGTMDGSSTTESGQDTTTAQESADKECPETDEDQYLFVCPTGFKRHPKYCNLFYQCTEDDDSHEMKVAVFNCPNNTIYDETKTQCVEEEKADKKCDGQIAQKRRVKRLDANYQEPITVGKEKYLCPAAGHFPFEKNEQCSSVLFKCEVSKTGKLRGFMYQCPEGYVYWSISRRCEPVNAMTDCKHSLSNWKGRHEIPIERSNIARKTIK